MKDITSVSTDLTVQDAQTSKAGNVFSIQIGDLEYAPEFGIDLKFFIDPELQFQNESFKSYLIQRLSEHHVNVTQVIDSIQAFMNKLTFVVGESEPISGGFIK